MDNLSKTDEFLNKEEKTEIIEIRNGKGDISSYFTGIKKLPREYCEQLYVNKSDNIDEVNKFLGKIAYVN